MKRNFRRQELPDYFGKGKYVNVLRIGVAPNNTTCTYSGQDIN